MKEADIDKIKSRNKRMKNENESQHDKIDYMLEMKKLQMK